MAQKVKRLSTMQETWVRSLGWEDSLEKEMATHSSTLALKILWTEELGKLQSMGLQRAGHYWVTFTFLFHSFDLNCLLACLFIFCLPVCIGAEAGYVLHSSNGVLPCGLCEWCLCSQVSVSLYGLTGVPSIADKTFDKCYYSYSPKQCLAHS